MPQRTLDLLDSLLAGEELTPQELDKLLAGTVLEDQFLEYKHGKELDDNKKATGTMRQYVSGFANSAGGILIIGVDETDFKVTGCKAPGGGDLAEWASRALTPIAPFLSPPPRFQTLKHAQDDVLIVTVARSASLVSTIEAGVPIFYLRFHDQTLKAPEYLVSDLALGRRQHPDLRITRCSLVGLKLVEGSSQGSPDVTDTQFDVGFTLENESLSWAEDIRVGLISLVQPSTTTVTISHHLLAYIDMQASAYDVTHFSHSITKLRPFDAASVVPSVSTGIQIPRRSGRSSCNYTWMAAAYVMSKESPPVWYQLMLRVDDQLEQWARHAPHSQQPPIDLHQLAGERPRVALHQMIWSGTP